MIYAGDVARGTSVSPALQGRHSQQQYCHAQPVFVPIARPLPYLR